MSKSTQQTVLEIIELNPKGISIKELAAKLVRNHPGWALGFGVEIEDIISLLIKNGKVVFSQSDDLVMPIKNQKSVFAITCNQNINTLREAEFYSTLDKAKTMLQKMAKERIHNMGVRHSEQDEMSFSFIFGWEEAHVKFSIVEIKLDLE